MTMEPVERNSILMRLGCVSLVFLALLGAPVFEALVNWVLDILAPEEP